MNLKLCDTCCDRSGTIKEAIKTGGCTCDICGWSCGCCRDSQKQFVNTVPVQVISAQAWHHLQIRNAHSLTPLSWEALFALGS